MGFDPWVGKIPCKREWQPTPVFLPLKSHGQRSLAVAKTRTWLSGSACTHTHTHFLYILQEEGSLPGPKSGLSSNTQKWIVGGDTGADRARGFIGKGRLGRVVGLGSPGGLLCHVALTLRFYGKGVSFQVVSGQSLWVKILLSGMCIALQRWIPVRKILAGW